LGLPISYMRQLYNQSTNLNMLMTYYYNIIITSLKWFCRQLLGKHSGTAY
jgi:hypothetical protein